ncbi:MAG TPA: helix-turn-helix domain-containing protein [Solirubrobacteraceae bacterium]|nr:helix-turn-helix domain-containing protein [Solirubrobacteraceae bacterium]
MPTATGRRYGGRAADERRAERRRRLLDAATELFGTRGYAATTIEALYTEARLAPRHFYEQFPGREQLLRAVYDEAIEAVAAAVGAARLTAPQDVRGRVRVILEAFAGAMLDDPRRARIAYREVPSTSRGLERHAHGVVRGFAGVVEEEARAAAERGLLPDRDYALAAMLLVGGTNAILLDWLADDERRPIADVLDELTGAFVAVLEQPR